MIPGVVGQLSASLPANCLRICVLRGPGASDKVSCRGLEHKRSHESTERFRER